MLEVKEREEIENVMSAKMPKLWKDR